MLYLTVGEQGTFEGKANHVTLVWHMLPLPCAQHNDGLALTFRDSCHCRSPPWIALADQKQNNINML